MNNTPRDDDPGAAGRETLVHNVVFIHLLRDLATELGKRGIPLLALKGSALLGLEYVEIADRRMSDVDILVRRADFSAVCDVILAMGGKKHVARSILQEESYELLFYLTVGGLRVSLDVHHAFVHPRAFPIDYDTVFRRSVPHPLEELRRLGVRRPAPEHLLVNLALHRVYEAYRDGLRDYEDASRIIRHATLDLSVLRDETGAWGTRVALYFFLWSGRARGLLTVPDRLLGAVSPPVFRRRIVGMFLDPAADDPFRLGIRSRRMRQILLFALFCERVLNGLLFPAEVAALKLRGLLGRRSSR